MIPWGESAYAEEQVLVRFDRFGRKDQLTVHALASSGASEEAAQGLAMLRTLLNPWRAIDIKAYRTHTRSKAKA